MARQFRQITGCIWTDQIAVRMRSQPPTVRVVAIYLNTAPMAHMTGLYPLTLEGIAGDVGFSRGRVAKAVQWLCDQEYCRWDAENSLIWVTNMAREQIGATLQPKDNRYVAVLEQLGRYRYSPLVQAFVRHYWDAYHFADVEALDGLELDPRHRPSSPGEAAPAPSSLALSDAQDDDPPEPLPSPFEAPCQAPTKPLGTPLPSQRTESREQKPENREQRESQSTHSPSRGLTKPLPSPSNGTSEPEASVPPLLLAEPVTSEHPDREACVTALWAHQNVLRAAVDPSQPPVCEEPNPGGNFDLVRRALAKYSPAKLVAALENAKVEAECKGERGEDPLEFFNGETNWQAQQLRRLLATTPEALRKRYRSKRARDGPSGRPRGPAQPDPPDAYAGGRVKL